MAQTNLIMVNPVAQNILKGSYTPGTYNPVGITTIPDSVVANFAKEMNADSIKAYWLRLGTFYNRSTGNQLNSTTQGITAAVNWVSSKFLEFSGAVNNRLIVSDFSFTQTICSATSHKEPVAIIPGNSLADKSILVLTSHLDSRNNNSCAASAQKAMGMEDNATGVAVFIEMARVMSKYSFKKNIIFLITIGEEQGLYGAGAFVNYLAANSIAVKANLNSDQLGSIYCNLPVNSPGCTTNNAIDTTSVRVFSNGDINSPAKSWARYVKLAYKDKVLPTASVPMKITLMAPIDRYGRGGDHIPFDNSGIAALRLMCANESGDGSGAANTRVHTVYDEGGKDLNSDGTIDSFYVDFNYMKRNGIINGAAITMAANAPATPTYTVTNIGHNKIRVQFQSPTNSPKYRVGFRSTAIDFDTVYTTAQVVDTFSRPPSSNGYYYVGAATMDGSSVTSFFGGEKTIKSNRTSARGGSVVEEEEENAVDTEKPYQLLQNYPNPFDEDTWITVVANKKIYNQRAIINIYDNKGLLLKSLSLVLNPGNNQVLYHRTSLNYGVLFYSLIIDGKKIDSKAMVYAN